jgi:hypothetical protein
VETGWIVSGMPTRLRPRSPWVAATVTVVLLVAVGIALIATAAAGQAARDIGVSLTGGGVIGLVFIFVQSVMTKAEDKDRLLLRLSASQDLTGIDLRGRDLARVALIGKRMTVADLSGTVLRSSKLIGTDLTWSNVRGADLTGAILVHARLDETDLRDGRLVDVDLRNVSFRNARLAGAVVDLADLSGARLDEAILDGVNVGRVWYDDQTTWPSGFEPPTPHAAVVQMHRDRPDWREYWAQLGGPAA